MEDPRAQFILLATAAAARFLALSETRFLLAIFDNLEPGEWRTRRIRARPLSHAMGLQKGSITTAYAALSAAGVVSRETRAGGCIYTFHCEAFAALIEHRRAQRERANAA